MTRRTDALMRQFSAPRSLVRGALLACCALLPMAATAQDAECLQSDALYADLDRHAVISFDQGFAAAPGVTNRFDMLIGDLALEGIVIWSGGVERPQAVLLHDCPEGDATAAELDACTLWQGIVYAIDAEGGIGLMPGATDVAAGRLLFPGLPWQLSFTETFAEGEIEDLPFEVFELTGCTG
ncbi:MAG: hypothetical protein ACXIVF_16810 [Rhizobiaceae bacterium]